jgi:hypothetical protein
MSQIIACAISWTAAIVAVLGTALSLRAQQQAQAALLAVRAERRTFSTGGSVITFDTHMSDAEVEAFKARWLEACGKPGGAHPVAELCDEETSGA